MRVLIVDPGETCGFVVLELVNDEMVDSNGHSRPEILLSWQEGKREGLVDLAAWSLNILHTFRRIKPHVLVLEDYRIYTSKANQHIGINLFTAELIGAITALCAIVIPPLPVIRMPAAKKGRWPKARLDNKFPHHSEVEGTHARDALLIGLAYLEAAKLWTP